MFGRCASRVFNTELYSFAFAVVVESNCRGNAQSNSLRQVGTLRRLGFRDIPTAVAETDCADFAIHMIPQK